MPEPIRIPVEVTGINQAVSDFERLNQAAQQAQASGRGVGGGHSRVSGPQSRYETAQTAFQASPNDFDTIYRYKQAQRGLERAENLVHGGNPWMDLIGTTRLNLGPISPLVNRLGAANPALGMGVGIAGLAMEGVKLLGEAARMAAQGLGEATAAAHGFGTARSLSGGTTEQIASLRSFGLSGDQINSLSGSFRNRLATDPLAMAAAGQLGINPQLARPYGPQNEAQFLVKAIEGLRGIQNEEERLRIARMTGLESLLDLAKVSGHVFQAMKRDAQIAATVFDERTVQHARDFSAEIGRVNTSLENVKVAWADTISPQASQVADFTTNLLNNIALDMKKPGAWTFPNTISMLPGFGGMHDKLPPLSPEEEARKANTAAVQDLSRIMGKLAGASGPRGEMGVPAGLRGSWPMLDAASRGAITKGAWKL